MTRTSFLARIADDQVFHHKSFKFWHYFTPVIFKPVGHPQFQSIRIDNLHPKQEGLAVLALSFEFLNDRLFLIFRTDSVL